MLADDLERPEIIVLDESNPRALINLLPHKMANVVKEFYAAEPDLFTLDEASLYQEMRDRGCTPTQTLNTVRVRFWLVYDETQTTMAKEMNMRRVYGNICDEVMFYRYIKDPAKVAWLLCPFASYMAKAHEALAKSINDLRDILNTPHFDEKGKLIVAVANMKLKIFNVMDNRIHGQSVQRIEQKTLVANVRDVNTLAQNLNEEELIMAIKKAKREELESMHVKQIEVIDDKQKND